MEANVSEQDNQLKWSHTKKGFKIKVFSFVKCRLRFNHQFK